MHKGDITADLVSRLVARQFPKWGDLPVVQVPLDGWDNTTFRLGDTMSVRLPSADNYVAQIDKEHRWLPVLRPALPLVIPEPLAKGEPDHEFPRPWSVYGWIDGDTASDATVSDRLQLALDLTEFLNALYRCDTTGATPAGAHSHQRGAPVTVWDEQVQGCLERLNGVIDVDGAREVWQAALEASPIAPPVWVHGDVTGTNLLVRRGKLCAVIDFGCSAVGDPACDTTIAYTYFDGETREAFTASLNVEPGTWARGRGWALWKALLDVLGDQSSPGSAAAAARRMGWRRDPAQIVDEVISDHHAHGAGY